MATIQAKDIAAIFDKLRDQRDEARAETVRALSDLVNCQDERAALRVKIELLKKTVGAGLLDYEANDVLNDLQEARAQAVSAGAEIMRLVVENGELRDTLQDWQVAAGTRQAEIDELRKRIAELTICDCGEHLSAGKCYYCDNDE